MVRGRSLGPQWLREKGVTPVVSSDGLKKMKESGSLLNFLKFLKVSNEFLKVFNKFLKVSDKFLHTLQKKVERREANPYGAASFSRPR